MNHSAITRVPEHPRPPIPVMIHSAEIRIPRPGQVAVWLLCGNGEAWMDSDMGEVLMFRAQGFDVVHRPM